jgi:hypothetical protein
MGMVAKMRVAILGPRCQYQMRNNALCYVAVRGFRAIDLERFLESRTLPRTMLWLAALHREKFPTVYDYVSR